jgi:hypothetical protein
MAEARICMAEATVKPFNLVYCVSQNTQFDTVVLLYCVRQETKWQSLKKKVILLSF